MLAFSQRTSLSASGMLLHVVLHQKLILLVCRFQVNSSNGKWCVTRIPVNGALSHPDVDHPLLEFVVHDGQGKWDKPQTGVIALMSAPR